MATGGSSVNGSSVLAGSRDPLLRRYPCCHHCHHVCICELPCAEYIHPLPGGHVRECGQCTPAQKILGPDLAAFYEGMTVLD